ncbi:hypothetical protein DUI87_07201 [Hirundo rustica rustica]|uniref:Reverse transcriptase domain-containing protein n=1 Tax=Hirundo rustica rustica TaxID=333673 RepID=A0A3M0KP66_HIRRU|nr:hypothetical protein DUI87_07201 [Hirundo rustica rustica]
MGFILRRFADDTKLCAAVDRLEGRDAIPRNLDRLERWDHVNLMKFNKAKCKVLQLSWGNPKRKYRLGGENLNNISEKNMGVLVDKNLDMNCQCVIEAQKAKRILGCIKSSMASRVREGIFLFYSAVVRPYLEFCVHLGGLQSRNDMDQSAQVQRRTMEVIRGLEQFSYEDKLRKVGLFNLEK